MSENIEAIKEIESYTYKALEKYWGYNEFRGNQKKALLSLIYNKNIVYIEKTGGGKSIVYQIPALLKKGLTIVVSPLKSLMKDQVKNLEQKGISATYLNSDLDEQEKKERFMRLMNGEYKLLYISPERLSSDNFINYLIQIPGSIQYFIIDEFDTISEYGATGFRPEFLELGEVKKKLEEGIGKNIPVGIFTATAPIKTIDMVIEMMGIKDNLELYKGKLVGDNLSVEIHKYGDSNEKDIYFYSYLETIKKELNKDKSVGIIFCSTTKDVDNIYKILNTKGYKIAKYHGKMTVKMKESTYNKFIKNTIDFVVCTNAFGRGIDKSNIRYILHYGTPGNISAYMQEVGRGGRDGKDYKAILLYCNQDINKRKFILRMNDNSQELLEEYDKFIEFLENENICRIQLLHKYFGFTKKEIPGQCGKCDNCDINSIIQLKESVIEKQEKQVVKNKKIVAKKKKKRKTTTKTRRK